MLNNINSDDKLIILFMRVFIYFALVVCVWLGPIATLTSSIIIRFFDKSITIVKYFGLVKKIQHQRY